MHPVLPGYELPGNTDYLVMYYLAIPAFPLLHVHGLRGYNHRVPREA